MFLYCLLIIIFGLPTLIMYPTRIVGRRNAPKKGAAIFAGNHQSGMDPILWIAYLPRYQIFMSKIENSKFFLTRWIISGIGSFFVDRKNPGVEAYKKGMKALKSGRVLSMYPEGTRREVTENAPELKNGLALYAFKSGAPIVPVVTIKKPRPFRFNTIAIGEPFYLEKISKPTKEDLAAASKLISEKMLETKENYLNRKQNKIKK